MIPFPVEIQPGDPVYEQVGKAVRRAMISGFLKPGDAFPSVRAISRDLRINPNTTHKVVSKLIDDGLLEVVPGRGTFVSRSLPETNEIRSKLLHPKAEGLIAEAKKLKMSRKEFLEYCNQIWTDLS